MRMCGWLVAVTPMALALAAACTGRGSLLQGDGLAPEAVAEGLRADYELFAQRCSKCHSLSRPLNSGIDDDGFWRRYVDRMRRQPASGISPADEAPILRFLHHYSLAVRRAKATDAGTFFPIPGVSLPAAVPSVPLGPPPRDPR